MVVMQCDLTSDNDGFILVNSMSNASEGDFESMKSSSLTVYSIKVP